MSTSKVFLNYTDWHEVDEDERTIPFHGGHQLRDSMTGIADLDMAHTPTNYYDIVASSNMKNSHYTDYHNVDEDVPTSSEQGGFLTSETGAGIAYRYINFSSDTTSTGVASSNIQNDHLYGLARCRRRRGVY